MKKIFSENFHQTNTKATKSLINFFKKHSYIFYQNKTQANKKITTTHRQ
jgi:hypothetical protein